MTWLEKQWLAFRNPYAYPRHSVAENKRFRDETRVVRLWHDLRDRLERIFVVRLACVVGSLLATLGIAFFIVWNVFGWLARAIPVLQDAGLL